ncbi:MAG: glycosyltransferase 87 family protein [Armatimonadota bacterium]
MLLSAAAAGLIVFFLGILHKPYDLHLCNSPIYASFAARIAHGQLPYRDFPVEYPPLAIPLLVIPGHSGSVSTYTYWFNAEMLLMCLAAAAATAAAAVRLWHSTRTACVAAVAFAACLLAAGSIVSNRYDAAVALVLAIVLLLLACERWRAAALLLGLGFALKLTPAILLPLVFVLAVRWRTVAWCALWFTLGAVPPFLLFMFGGVSALSYPFTYQLHRPLELESVLATPLLVGHVLHRITIEISGSFGSMNVLAGGAVALSRVSPLLELAAVGLTYGLIWRRRATLRATPRLVPLCVLALVLAFVSFGKVLSPQYFVWILPAIALVMPERRALGLLLLGTLMLTQIVFPWNWLATLNLARGPVLVLIERNVWLVLAFAVSLWYLWCLPAVDEAAVPAGSLVDVRSDACTDALPNAAVRRDAAG